MSEENAPSMTESPGQILKAARVQYDLTIEQVVAETKISASVVRAMEENDFSKLPAPAFTKGFYTLYAKTLGLDAEHLVALYQSNSDGKGANKHKDVHQNDVGELTKRPFVPIFSIIGFTLLLLLLILGTLSWYFSWNPADYLSQQLRGVETEYHEEQDHNIGAMDNAPSLSVKPVTTIKYTGMESESAIQFPAKGDTQGIEISKLSKPSPLLTLSAPPIVPQSIIATPTPQTALQ